MLGKASPTSPTSPITRSCWAALGGALLFALSACGEAPEGARTLNRGNGPEVETLDPHKARSDGAAQVLRDLYEGLVGETPQGELIPGAAARWEIGAGGRIYTFYLREDARWSNGDPVTAQDFVAGLRRTVTPATGAFYATVLFPIKNAEAVFNGSLPPEELGVTAPDETTLRIELNAPTPYFLGLLTHHSTYPIHRPSLAEHGEHFARPGRLIGNGAYRLTDWVLQSYISLARNPYYWNDAATRIDAVNFHHIEDEASELKRYRAGELDITYTIPSPQFPWLQANLPGELRIAPFLSTYFYAFNISRPPFKDAPELRRALSMAVDRRVIAEKIVATGQLPAWGFVPPGVAHYATQTFGYAGLSGEERLREARRLYRAAGYGPDNPLRVEIRYNTGEIHARIAAAIAAMWKDALGVETTLVGEEFKVFLQNRVQMRVTRVFRSAWVGDYNDATTFLDILRGDSVINDTGYRNAEYDALLAQAAVTADTVRRREALQEAERLMLAEHPIMPLYFYVSRHMVKPYVGGWTDHVMDRHYTKDLYFRDDDTAAP